MTVAFKCASFCSWIVTDDAVCSERTCQCRYWACVWELLALSLDCGLVMPSQVHLCTTTELSVIQLWLQPSCNFCLGLHEYRRERDGVFSGLGFIGQRKNCICNAPVVTCLFTSHIHSCLLSHAAVPCRLLLILLCVQRFRLAWHACCCIGKILLNQQFVNLCKPMCHFHHKCWSSEPLWLAT